MKNLQLLSGLEFDECPLLSECSLLSINVDTGILYGASKSHVFAFECKEEIEIIEYASLKDEGLLDGNHSIVSIQYVPDQFCLSIATSNGELILWNHNNMPHFESVGSVDGGISDMSWSHDFELLVLATGKKSMILMSRDFEPVIECPLDSSQFGEAELVSVGWGKKETQFHGSEGKAAATRKFEGSTSVFHWDDKKPRITWRGDNQYFAVHYVDESLNSRKFKIWTREGKLHSTSAPTSGLAQAISFRTQGNLLACTGLQQNEHKVLFFEKNGLQHGDFVLPLPGDNSKVKELSWNLDSSVLAVFCETDESSTQVQLWTTSNYHWYMKQCLVFSGADRISCLLWDQECPLKLHLVTSSGKHFKYTWIFHINKSLSISDENDANVGVIDGANLSVTPFARCVVPPPMSAYVLNVPSPIHAAMFGSEERVNDVLVLSIDGSLHWFSHLSAEFKEDVSKYEKASVAPDATGGNGFKIQCPLPTLRAQARFTIDGNTPLSDHHFTWLDGNELLACGIFHNKQTVKRYHVCWQTGMVLERGSVEVPAGKHVLATDFHSTLKVLLVEMNDGSCYRLNIDEMLLSPWFEIMGGHFAFPRPCQRVSLICYEDKEILIGLTEQFRFFLNGNELAQDCTSYEVHKNFVLLTTHSHILRSLHLKDLLINDPSLSTGESARALERGSKLICLIPRETKVVLQMPRGNLEVIHPRSLLMEAIQSDIVRVNYKQAFELCRKHRVNMNILIDHDISAFIQHISNVVEQLNTTHNINLLMSDLQEEDYTKSMYSSYYKNRLQEKLASSKVDSICEAFKEEMKKKDEKKFFLSILMTYLKRSPPNIEGALIEVKRMKDELQDSLKFTDDALKFLTYMVEVNILYDVALGTYDLKLALMVAEKSQKDPKEYLPYLNELKAMKADMMKYTIDMKLKRYSKALLHISHLGVEHFSECKKLVVEQRLYAEALSLYAVDADEYKEIAFAYAEYLEAQRKHEESGMTMFKAGNYKEALRMFEESKNWRFAFCCASKLDFAPVEVVELARKLAGLLIDAHRFLEAAQILEMYADDYEEAVVALISGHNWDEALRIIYKHKRMDLLEVNFKPSLKLSADNFLEMIEKTHDDFTAHKERLMEVRRTKEMQSDLMREGGDMRQNCDLYSDTSSIADGESVASSSATTDSRSSRKTGKSSKSRQKLARKKWSLRKGGPTEEFALIELLHKVATMVHGWKAEMGVLLRTLFMFNEDKKAGLLQKKLEVLIECIDQAIPLIWTGRNPSANNDSDMVYGPHMSSNSIVQARSAVDNLTPVPSDPILVTPPTFDKKDSTWKLSVLEFDLSS